LLESDFSQIGVEGWSLREKILENQCFGLIRLVALHWYLLLYFAPTWPINLWWVCCNIPSWAVN